MTEHELFLQAQAGDIEAFEDLRERLYTPVRRFVRRLIGMHDAEDDIIQDVFIALYYNLHRINSEDSMRPYLFRMVRNRCYDELRRRGRYDVLSLDDEPVQMWVSLVKQSASKPEELTHWMLLYLEVQEAMEQLPELQRQALILYSEENLSYAEIAEVMDVNIGTVKSRLYHAKQNLRRLLHPDTLRAVESD